MLDDARIVVGTYATCMFTHVHPQQHTCGDLQNKTTLLHVIHRRRDKSEFTFYFTSIVN